MDLLNWIDSHVHLGSDRDGKEVSLSEIKSLFNHEQLDKAVVFCFDEKKGIGKGNGRILEIIEDNEKIAGLFRINPKKHSLEDLRNTEKFSGFKLHPHAQDFELKNISRYLDVLEKIGKPVLFHVGHWGEKPHPEDLMKVAENYSNLKLIFAHSLRGYYFKATKEFNEMLKGNDNIYLDLSFQASPSAVETLIDNLGSERLLFASDYPYGHPAPVKKSVELADISKEEIGDIAYRNAQKLFFD